MTDSNVFDLRARLARVNRTEDRPIDGPPLIEFGWDDDSPVTFRDLPTLDDYVKGAIDAVREERLEPILRELEGARHFGEVWARRIRAALGERP